MLRLDTPDVSMVKPLSLFRYYPDPIYAALR